MKKTLKSTTNYLSFFFSSFLSLLTFLSFQTARNKAANAFKVASDTNHAAAQDALGVCYSIGFGIEQDLSKAFFSFQRSADQGLPSAMKHLSLCYLHGHGTEKDPDAAQLWTDRYEQAITQTSLPPIPNLQPKEIQSLGMTVSVSDFTAAAALTYQHSN